MQSLNLPSILTPDFGLLFWMLVAFLVVFVLLAKYGFPVIVKMVEDRKKFIDESLKNAREANEKLANIKSEGEDILRVAREQQAVSLKEAMAARDNILKEAKEKAQREGQKLVEEAKAQIAVEKENAMREIRSQIGDLSIKIASKVVQRDMEQDKEQERFIEQVLKEMESAR